MDSGDIEKLKKHHFVLVKDMDPDDVVDFLFSAGILNDHHVKEIYEHQDSKKKNRQLLDTLKNRGQEAFCKFLEALLKTNQHELAKLFDGPDQPDTTWEKTERSGMYAQSSKEDWLKNLKTAQQSLKKMYLTRFQKVHPFSLPFTFDIENTWVSLAFKEGNNMVNAAGDFAHPPPNPFLHYSNPWTQMNDMTHSEATEDHAKVLKKAFEKAKMLIIEGGPAIGKTSLMRRLAYEWATEKKELTCFDLIIYAEFREVRGQTFESIADLIIQFIKKYNKFLDNENLEYLKILLNNKRNCEEQRILLLLDGYDESSLDKQCEELSTYISSSAIQSPLMFHVVLTTRPGYLSKYRGNKGRFLFAEILGFTTKQQKEKYIFNHYLSQEIDNKENIAAVHHLLNNNQNLNKLAETPLFLTFICLVHERIVDGTLVELYCNIIWWIIDRHQKNNPDQNIPVLFGYQNSCNDKFETIQEHYLRFPQLYCLGKMALHNLQENVFKPSDCAQFNLQPIIEQVGLLRKERNYDSSFKLITSFFFPHRTIQEFLAAFYCLCSNDPTSKWLLADLQLDTAFRTNEYVRFLLRIILSDKMPIQSEKRKYYFERIADIILDITFDAFITTDGFNSKLLNWFLSGCTNLQNITMRGKLNSERELKMRNDQYLNSETSVTSKSSSPIQFSLSGLMNMQSISFEECTFKAGSQLSFKNCSSLNSFQFNECLIESGTNLGIETLPVIDNMQFRGCEIDMASWQSITDAIRSIPIKCLKLTFGIATYSTANSSTISMIDFNKEFLIHLQKCSNVEKMEIKIGYYKINQDEQLSFSDLIKLDFVAFRKCTFEANSQISFTKCASLQTLKFDECEIRTSTKLDIASMRAIHTVEFYQCKIDLTIWQSLTDEIRNSSIKLFQVTFGNYLSFNKLSFGEDFSNDFLTHLQKCNNVEKMEITLAGYKIRQNDLLSFRDLMKLNLLKYDRCIFEVNSTLTFTNCPLLKNFKFIECEIEGSTNLGFATLPAIDTMLFYGCKIDLTAWQSLTNEIRNSSVKFLELNCGQNPLVTITEFNEEFLIDLRKCNKIEIMKITIFYNNRHNDSLSFSDWMSLQSLTFWLCTFEAHSQLSFTNCPSMNNLKFNCCMIESSTNLVIATLLAINIVQFDKCRFDSNSHLSIMNCPSLKKLQFIDCVIENGINLDIATLPAIATVGFFNCRFDMAAWQSIIHAISNSPVKCLQLSANLFVEETYPEFLHHLQKCKQIEHIDVMDGYGDVNSLNHLEEEVTASLAQTAQKLLGLTSITIWDAYGRRLKERNKEQIESAGQERNSSFLITYAE